MIKRFLLLFLFGILLMYPIGAQELPYSYLLTDQNPGDIKLDELQKFLESLDVDESGEEITEELLLLKKRFHVNFPNKLIFSHESGYFNAGFDLHIRTEAECEHLIYYTLDGSIPSPESFRYQDETPIEILPDTSSPMKARLVRSRSYSDSIPTSKVYSKTFLVHPRMEERFTFPVISLISDPDNLYNHDTGIYVKGANYDPNNPTWSGNWFMTGIEWERDVHIQYFTTSGELVLDQAAGVRIHGALQRNAPQKSLRLYARSEYGQKAFNYRLLPQKGKSEYKRFILRTSYGCWNNTVIKDPLAACLVKGLGFQIQDYRPVIVFINGDYWGIQTIRDYLGTHHLAAKYHLDKDAINIGVDEHVYEGTTQAYLELEGILDSLDLSAPETLDEIAKKLDLNSTINYYNSEIYLNNYDWPAGNRRWWNTNEYDRGRMRWLFFDLDAAFNARGGASHNMLQQATVPSSSWPNPPNRTKLLSSLLQNPVFKNEFITRAAYLMNYHLHADTIIPVIYKMKAEYAPEMPEHILRWNYRTYSAWENYIESALVGFSRDRRQYVNQHYISKFGLSGTSKLKAAVNDRQMGIVYVNDMPVPNENSMGEYFNDVPVRITAVPNQGFKFSHWASPFELYHDTLTLTLSSDTTILANFVPDLESIDLLKINEVMSKNVSSILDNYNEHEDWIEIYNGEDLAVDLAGYYLSDDPELPFKWQIRDRFAGHSTLQANGFTVFFADNETHQGLLHCNFKLNSSGETITLIKNKAGIPVIIDSISYKPLQEDYSWGRVLDGSCKFRVFTRPTPGASNVSLASEINEYQQADLHIFPNPSTHYINVHLRSELDQICELTFINMSGIAVKTVHLKGVKESIDISDLQPGIYLIRVLDYPGLNFKLMVQ